MTGWAQDVTSTGIDPAGEPKPEAGETAGAKASKPPLEVAGYVGFRQLMDDQWMSTSSIASTLPASL